MKMAVFYIFSATGMSLTLIGKRLPGVNATGFRHVDPLKKLK